MGDVPGLGCGTSPPGPSQHPSCCPPSPAAGGSQPWGMQALSSSQGQHEPPCTGTPGGTLPEEARTVARLKAARSRAGAAAQAQGHGAVKSRERACVCVCVPSQTSPLPYEPLLGDISRTRTWVRGSVLLLLEQVQGTAATLLLQTKLRASETSPCVWQRVTAS